MTALVTGASRGIGLAIARELADVGYNLSLVARSEDALERVAAEITAATETRGASEAGASCNDTTDCPIWVKTIAADLAQEESYGRIVAETVAEFGGIDLLVNCAGLAQQGSFTDVTPAEWDTIFSVNAKAPFFICKEALPYLKQSQKPIIINIASVVGFKGYIHQSVYSSSKHALTGFTKVLAKEVQPFGIRVHLISPGGVATEMVTKMRPDIKPDELLQPEEIAEIVRFLVTRKGRGTIDQFYLRRYSSLAFD
ncbi:MAG: SDR family oxidoreductase [Bacteroidales bacterium]|nr:SDR family oxidoreductase [Bacteroidales bacterium]